MLVAKVRDKVGSRGPAGCETTRYYGTVYGLDGAPYVPSYVEHINGAIATTDLYRYRYCNAAVAVSMFKDSRDKLIGAAITLISYYTPVVVLSYTVRDGRLVPCKLTYGACARKYSVTTSKQVTQFVGGYNRLSGFAIDEFAHDDDELVALPCFEAGCYYNVMREVGIQWKTCY